MYGRSSRAWTRAGRAAAAARTAPPARRVGRRGSATHRPGRRRRGRATWPASSPTSDEVGDAADVADRPLGGDGRDVGRRGVGADAIEQVAGPLLADARPASAARRRSDHDVDSSSIARSRASASTTGRLGPQRTLTAMPRQRAGADVGLERPPIGARTRRRRRRRRCSGSSAVKRSRGRYTSTVTHGPTGSGTAKTRTSWRSWSPTIGRREAGQRGRLHLEDHRPRQLLEHRAGGPAGVGVEARRAQVEGIGRPPAPMPGIDEHARAVGVRRQQAHEAVLHAGRGRRSTTVWRSSRNTPDTSSVRAIVTVRRNRASGRGSVARPSSPPRPSSLPARSVSDPSAATS